MKNIKNNSFTYFPPSTSASPQLWGSAAPCREVSRGIDHHGDVPGAGAQPSGSIPKHQRFGTGTSREDFQDFVPPGRMW